MARKADIKVCRFAECNHPGKIVNIAEDDYVADGRSYYHKDCFDEKEQRLINERLAKSKRRKCGYYNCNHPQKIIDTGNEEFVTKEGRYYHIDCWKEFEKVRDTEEILRADIQLIKNMWIENISNTVVIQRLYQELNKLIRDQGIDPKYVIFVLDYCIKHKFNLRYPAGLKYFVDNSEIKCAYDKAKAKKKIEKADFTVKETEDTAPKFSINKKPGGFNSILSGKR